MAKSAGSLRAGLCKQLRMEPRVTMSLKILSCMSQYAEQPPVHSNSLGKFSILDTRKVAEVQHCEGRLAVKMHSTVEEQVSTLARTKHATYRKGANLLYVFFRAGSTRSGSMTSSLKSCLEASSWSLLNIISNCHVDLIRLPTQPGSEENADQWIC